MDRRPMRGTMQSPRGFGRAEAGQYNVRSPRTMNAAAGQRDKTPRGRGRGHGRGEDGGGNYNNPFTGDKDGGDGGDAGPSYGRGQRGGAHFVTSPREKRNAGGGDGDFAGKHGGGDGVLIATSVSTDGSRGAMRGRRHLGEVVQSRPVNMVSKCGKRGQQIVVQANYFRVLRKPEWCIHQYRVDFSPEVAIPHVRRFFIQQHSERIGSYVFDGETIFCSRFFVEDKDNRVLEVVCKDRNGQPIQMKLKHVGLVDATNYQHLQVLNLILRHAVEKLQMQLVGRHYYDAAAKITVQGYHLELWPGYLTSIRQHEQDVLLCTDILHKAIRTDTVYDILSSCLRESREIRSSFAKQVVGSIVLTGYNNETYRVDDVDFNVTPSCTFKGKDGDVSYIQYYKQKYNLNIRDKDQPMLVSRPNAKRMRGGCNENILLVPELCHSTGLTDIMRGNFRLMKAMSEHTRLSPERRIDRLSMFNKRLQNCEKSMELLNSWHMKLDAKLVEIPARILPPERILFGRNKSFLCSESPDWSREFRQTHLFAAIDIKRWQVIVPRPDLSDIQAFVKTCITVGQSMGLRISEPNFVVIPDDRNSTYAHIIDEVALKDPQIIMVALKNINAEKYSCVKKKCCNDHSVPSQVVTLKTIAPRGNRGGTAILSIATKVVIQMNAKLMGAPWMVEIPLRGMMVVGFDVCHSGKENNKSFGALVASMDMKHSTRYFSNVMIHSKGQELSNEISMNMVYAIKTYRSLHNSLPDRIIFYRDGVGEGQLHQVFQIEVEKIKQRLSEIYKTAGIELVRFCFIVVSKKINTRFFHRKQNPASGTVVDTVVTLPERYDFFLVSQSVRQGTVSPTNYNILYDSTGLSADQLQVLSYKLTHLYYNYTGTLQVPAVCQYAHKLALLVAQSLHAAPRNGLENQLYFL